MKLYGFVKESFKILGARRLIYQSYITVAKPNTIFETHTNPNSNLLVTYNIFNTEIRDSP